MSPESVEGPSTKPVPSSSKGSRRQVFDFVALLGSGTTCGRASGSCPATPSGGGAARSSCTSCGSGSGRTCTPSSSRSAGTSACSATTEPARPAQIHTAALAGLLSHVGLAEVRDEPATGAAEAHRRSGARPSRPGTREYLGRPRHPVRHQPRLEPGRSSPRRSWSRPRSSRPPGSGPGPSPAITAEQVEEVGQHLLNRQYSEPHWSARAGAVLAYEQVSLYGVPIVARRRVAYGSGRTRRGPGDLPPLGAGRGPMADPPHVLPGQRRASRRGRRSWRSGPGAATWSSTTRRSSRSTMPAFRLASRRPPTSTPGGRRRGGEMPDLLTLTLADLTADERGPDACRLPVRMADRRSRAGSELRLRARAPATTA